MKKILLFASALAGLFLAGSCQRENLEPQAEGQQVTFTIEAPAALQTKAIADGLNVNELIYEVWITEGQNETDLSGATRLYQATTEMKQDGDRMKANITLDLVNDQNFTVLFWAQKSGIGVYDTEWLNAVTYTDLAAEAYAANDNRLDAFYAKAFVVDCQTATPTVTLKRPFAQVNLCTLNNKEAAQQAGDYNIALVSSKMRLDAVPTVFNVATSDATNYVAMEFAVNDVPSGDDEKITVNGKEYYYAGMNYVFAGANILLTYDIQTKLNETVDANVNNTIQNVPLKENHRTNIVGNLLTSKTDYEIIVDAAFNEPDYGEVYSVTTDEQLKKALTTDTEIINIILGADLNISSGDVSKLGGPETKKIIIDGSQILTRAASADVYTLNINTTYDARFYAVNPEATIVLKNLKLTNSKASGTWDTYDIMFNNDVEFENVHALKPLAFTGENKTAKLQNVTIDELNNDYYALWICAKGTNVEWNGGAVNSPKGRGIKIDDQYVKNPAATTLKVTGVDFNTAKKGAILVKSSAETNIEVSDVNIVDVLADPINAVWVDEDAAEHFDLVTVTGASKVLEGSDDVPAVVTNAEELKAAIKAAPANATEATTIYLKAGTYTGCFDIEESRNVILTSNEDAVIDGLVHGNSGNYITLKGLTLTNETPAKTATSRHQADGYCVGGYANCFHIEDCTFNVKSLGAINIYAAFNANKEEYELTVLNSTFNCNGFTPIRCKTNTKIDGCTFNDQKRYSMQFQANSQAASEKVVFINNTVNNPCVTSGEPFAAGVQISHSQLCEEVALTISGNTLNSELFSDLKFAYDWEEGCASCQNNMKITTCTLNGKQIVAGQCWPINDDAYEVQDEVTYTYDEATATYTIYNAKGLKWVANEVNKVGAQEPNIFDNATIMLANDIDLAGEEWIPIGDFGNNRTVFRGVFDGKGKTVSNFKVTKKTTKTDPTGKNQQNNCSYGLFGNVNGTVKNLTVSGAAIDMSENDGRYVAALVGRMHGGLIENCSVMSSTIVDDNWTVGALVGQLNDGKISKCSVEKTTITGSAAVSAIVGIALKEGERTIENCSVKECTIVQNGSFGGDYDKMFGAIVGSLYSGTLTVNLNNCSVEETTIKGVASNALCGFVSEGDKLFINGYEPVADGVSMKDGEYYITNANGFLWVEAQTDSYFANKTIKLANDIDMAGVAVKPIRIWNPEEKNCI